MIWKTKQLAIIGLITLFSVGTSQLAYASMNKGESRINFIGKLIEKSKAAQQIEKSGVPEALERRDQARAIYQQALEAHKSGDKEATKKLLNEASKVMFEAVRMAKSDEVVAVKKKRDFESRAESIKALLEAQTRVSNEKHDEDAEQKREQINAHVAKANELYDQGLYGEGRKELDKAYNILKVSIESMRGGETLVRDLNFETSEEEYDYELDRNNTHQMLVKNVVAQKKPRPRTLERIEKFVAKAKEIRKEAEEQAADGDHADAIKTLEKSTKELIRAIRAAGLFIPG